MVIPIQNTTFALSTQYFYLILIIHPFYNYPHAKANEKVISTPLSGSLFCAAGTGERDYPLQQRRRNRGLHQRQRLRPPHLHVGRHSRGISCPSNNDYYHVYGFNGLHLGWYERGVVRDHDGYVVGFQQGTMSKSTRYEPYKRYKKSKPYKYSPKYPPSKAYNKSSFSYTSLALFLLKGKR